MHTASLSSAFSSGEPLVEYRCQPKVSPSVLLAKLYLHKWEC